MGRKILVINGSASDGSSNQRLIDRISEQLSEFEVTVFNDLKKLPHFDPKQSDSNPPNSITDFRTRIEQADGLIICTPEYVFSIPSGLKNAIEWCISTVILSGKPTGIIVASGLGEKAFEELKLIMNTVTAKFNEDTTLLISGIKGKINQQGEIIHEETKQKLTTFVQAFASLVRTPGSAQ